MTLRQRLTTARIDKAVCPPGKSQVLMADAEVPSLSLRVTSAGAKSYVFESKLHRQTIRMTIGSVSDWTVGDARNRARELKVKVDQGIDPRDEIRQQHKAREQAKADALEAGRITLRHLLSAYCDHLEALGRESHKKARGIFKLHVFEAWPQVASLPAREVTAEQIADMQRRVIEQGKGRQSNKLRAYMRAAYAVAARARVDSRVPVAFKAFKVTVNPAEITAVATEHNRADKNPLTLTELRQYWHILQRIEGVSGAFLRMHILTGGQRLAQLARLKCADVDLKEGVIKLMDGKGRPGNPPREHVVPLLPAAVQLLKTLPMTGEYVFSHNNGVTPIAPGVRHQLEAIRMELPDLEYKRVRSGVETLLAARGVSSDVRGRLQSHGVSGIQARHYDAHSYLKEKRSALERLIRALEEPLNNNRKVVSMRRDSEAA